MEAQSSSYTVCLMSEMESTLHESKTNGTAWCNVRTVVRSSDSGYIGVIRVYGHTIRSLNALFPIKQRGLAY